MKGIRTIAGFEVEGITVITILVWFWKDIDVARKSGPHDVIRNLRTILVTPVLREGIGLALGYLVVGSGTKVTITRWWDEGRSFL